MSGSLTLKSLRPEHLQDLRDSGLSDETIALMEPESLTVKEALDYGFFCVQALKIGKTENLLDEKYIHSCMLLKFHGLDAEQQIDRKTQTPLAVIKIFYKQSIQDLFKDRLPKYLCLAKSKQTKQVIHFPRCFDWASYLAEEPEKRKPIHSSEGIKKAEKACQEGIPTIAVWSTWCFNEGSLDSPLIEDIVFLLQEFRLDLYIVYDSDKTYKDGVAKAQEAFANKIFKETGQRVRAIDLPHKLKNFETKGLDDFLVHASVEEFYKLRDKAEFITNSFIESGAEAESRPQAPFLAMPQIFQDYIRDLKSKYEGPLEVAAMALFCSVSAVARTTITFSRKKLNFFAVGLCQTTSGKTAIATECMRPLKEINTKLYKEYKAKASQELEKLGKKASTAKISTKTEELIITQFTREGLIYKLAYMNKFASGLYFAKGEYEQFLQQIKREYNVALPSFLNDLYDGDEVREDLTKGTLQERLPITIENVSVSISGVSTEAGFIKNLPKNACENGFIQRQAFFLGTDRGIDVLDPVPVDTKIYKRLKNILLVLHLFTALGGEIEYRFDEESKNLFSEFYLDFKKSIRSDNENPVNPSLIRDVNDYAKKLAVIFQITLEAEELLLTDQAQEYLKGSYLPLKGIITKPALGMALEWAKYFMASDKYLFRHLLKEFKDQQISMKTKCINILKKFPKGISRTQLIRKLGLQQAGSGGANTLNSLVKDLSEEDLIKVEKRGKALIYMLREYLV